MSAAPTARGASVVSAHDAVLFDLDGVVYLGQRPVPWAAEGVAALRQAGVGVGFVTNNAARSPHAVAEHLTALGVPSTPEDVITSAQAAARLLADRLPAGARVMVVGTEALEVEVRSLGLVVVEGADDAPAGLIQGYDPQLAWPRLNEAAHAIQGGAVWVATNTDSNRPTERGLVPGHGTAVAAVRAAVEVDPLVAGKPSSPLMVEAVRRLGAVRPLFVGDRLDTDVAGARTAGLASAFVLTGSHGKRELMAAGPDERPDHLIADLRGLLAPRLTVRLDGDVAECGDLRVRVVDSRLEVPSDLAPQDQLAAVWAGSHLVWAARESGTELDVDALLRASGAVA